MTCLPGIRIFCLRARVTSTTRCLRGLSAEQETSHQDGKDQNQQDPHHPLHTNREKTPMGIPYFVASIVRAHRGIVKALHSPHRTDALLIDFNCFLHR